MYITYEDAEHIMNRLKKARINCRIVELPDYTTNASCIYYILDENDKNLCVLPSDNSYIEFVMQGPLKFDNTTLCCNPVDLYRFSENREDLDALIEELIARHKICLKIQKLFNSEIHKHRKYARETGSDNFSVKARIKELNNNMHDAYKVQEIGL